MSNLCIIPARGGSKRIPRKNIREFVGKPIIAYSIEVALASGLFDEVMVSTDDSEIAEIAKKFGASVPFLRSKPNADDFSTLSDVIEEVKAEYTEQDKSFSYICCILPTSPLLTIDLIKAGLEKLKVNPSLASIKPILRYSYPIQRALKLNPDSSETEMLNTEYKNTRSQDLNPCFHDAGQFYWMKFEKGLKEEPKGGFEIPEIYAQDIDTIEDWKIAEFKYKYINDIK